MNLGKLKKVDLRAVWTSEPNDFTKWLSKEENLNLLGEEIGIDISLKETEASAGRYYVDILAEEENTGRNIIIENQLEHTNHDHLGKIITYASGYDAEIIIWIVKDVRDEHKQAIDWLNDHTDEKANFLIVKVELWRIGESPIAPKFQIISQPNDWAKTLKESGRPGVTDTQIRQLDFWTKFKEYAQERKTKLRLSKVFPQHWYDISCGIPEAHISLTVDTRNRQITCQIYIPDSKDTYHKFHDHKDEIENELNEKLEWSELPEKKASRIKLSREGDITKSEEWDDYFDWLLVQAGKLKKVFSKYAKITGGDY